MTYCNLISTKSEFIFVKEIYSYITSELEIMEIIANVIIGIYISWFYQNFSYLRSSRAVEFVPDYGKLLDRVFALYLPLIISSVRNRTRSIPER